MNVLRVVLHGQTVGTLIRRADDRIAFRLVGRYVEDPDRPVLGQCFEDDLGRVWWENQPNRAPRWFANLLPEHDGLVRRLVAEAHGLDPEDDFALLSVLGTDLPGAVVILPGTEEEGEFDEIGEEPSEAVDHAIEGLRFSLAGVQLKFSVVFREGRVTLPGRAETGAHILKVAASHPGVAENEAAMLAWAGAAGLDVAEARLVDLPALPGLERVLAGASGRALLVRRFDRVGAERIHQEDFAQVARLPPALKYRHVTYEGLTRLADAILGSEGALECVRRLTVMVAQGNADAHLKNWSLRYVDPVRPIWSPLYDLVSTIAWPDVDNRIALKLAGAHHFRQIDLGDFHRLAERAGLPVANVERVVLDTLDRLRGAWSDLPSRGELPEEHEARLREHWAAVPLLRRSGPLGA